ncbi:MAG: hypothetical protein AVDCRST_MAG77-4527 [uncultured Chloroflexi bacterium]|uniref:Uncharacterized protein n=1 Tax=uncultured Chloroflexota bacterium TaxID=166587 RepID=A0A6J4JWD2_9CHLR|nr:MAG: hypothetical protein AVDCRST_MAG77-4527 [uncultured Chloroflexota bacterium]
MRHARRDPFRPAADGAGGLLGAAAGEDPQVAQQALPLGREQRVAPGDGAAQRLVPFRQSGRRAAEQAQRGLAVGPLEPREQRLGGEQLGPRRRQLQGQGQPVEPGADLRHLARRVRAEPEVRLHRAGALDEQRHRRHARQLRRRREPLRIRHRQGAHGQLPLAVHVQRGAARGEYPQAGAGGQQLPDVLRRGEHMLHVVQHEQDGARSQLRRQLLQNRPSGVRAQAKRARRRAEHQRGVTQGRERREAHAARKDVPQAPPGLQGEPGLARAGGADKSEQPNPGPGERVDDAGQLLVAPEERAGRGRKRSRQRARRSSRLAARRPNHATAYYTCPHGPLAVTFSCSPTSPPAGRTSTRTACASSATK